MIDKSYRYKIQQGVEAQLSAIVDQIIGLVNQTKPERNGMKTSQLDNFLGVARETSSIAVVENWIRYQIGRNQGAWNKEKFGEAVLLHIAGWREMAADITASAYQIEKDKQPTSHQIEMVWIELVRQYAGQLRRYFVYVAQDDRGQD